MIVDGVLGIGPRDCPVGTSLVIKPCTRPVRMYVISRGCLQGQMSGLMRDGTTEPVSRNLFFRRERGQETYIFLPVQLTTSRIGNPTYLTLDSLPYVMTLHTPVHTPLGRYEYRS